MNKKHGGYPWLLLLVLFIGAFTTLLFGTVGGGYVISIMVLTLIIASFFR